MRSDLPSSNFALRPSQAPASVTASPITTATASDTNACVRLRFASALPLFSAADPFSRRIALGDTRGFDPRSAVPASMIVVLPLPGRHSFHRPPQSVTISSAGRLRIGHHRADSDGCDRGANVRLTIRSAAMIFDDHPRSPGQTVAVAARGVRPSRFDAIHELATNYRTLAESFRRLRLVQHSPRFVPASRRATSHFGHRKRRLR